MSPLCLSGSVASIEKCMSHAFSHMLEARKCAMFMRHGPPPLLFSMSSLRSTYPVVALCTLYWVGNILKSTYCIGRICVWISFTFQKHGSFKRLCNLLIWNFGHSYTKLQTHTLQTHSPPSNARMHHALFSFATHTPGEGHFNDKLKTKSTIYISANWVAMLAEATSTFLGCSMSSTFKNYPSPTAIILAFTI